VSPPTPELWQQEYQIAFTPEEMALLTGKSGPMGQQRAHLLKLALRPEQCPACKFVLCPRSAWTGHSFDPGEHGDGPGYACPACGAELIHCSGTWAGQHWMELAPDQIVRIYGPQDM
jgi:hypothetical protein